MSAAHLLPPQTATEPLPRKRFTRADVEQLLETGIFAGQRFELIDGDLVDKMGQNPPHAFTIGLVLNWLASFLGTRLVRVQLSIEASGDDRERSVPEPDVAVLREWKAEYQYRHPKGDELLLVVEVADTSAAFDLSRKAILYARASVPEYWVLDLSRRMLVIHRQSDGTQYRHIQLHSEDEVVTMEGRSETVKIADILPSRA